MKKSQSVPLVFALLFGLTLSLIPLTTAYSGSLNACQGNSATTASLKLGGRTITPSLLLQAAGNSPCPTGESSFSLGSLSRTILVSPYGSPTQNGTTLLAAMFFIGVAHPSATNPWLLKLEPGLYDLGNLALPMLPYVDLEGSGEGTTLISSTIGAASPVTGTLIAASHSQVRFVSIASSGSNTNQITVFVPNGTTQASFLHVTLSASSPGGSSNFGLYNNCGCPADAPIMLQDSTVNVSGPDNSSDTALYNDGGAITVQGSTLNALGGSSLYGIDNHNGALNVERSNLNALGDVSGSSEDYGIFNNGVAYVRSSNIVVYGGPNTGGQKIGISNATSNFGTTSVVVQNSNVKAVGGSTAIALRNANNGGATIQNSSLLATGGYAIYRVNGQINVAASALDGLGSPGLTCVASYKADFTALGNTCT